MIKFEHVTKKYGEGTVALDDVSFNIGQGEFVFLVGPSGAGKTTILRLLLREIVPNKGKIYIDGEDIVKIPNSKVPLLRRKIGTAFQDFKLLFDRTVLENVSLALEIAGQKPETAKKTVEKVLTLVGLKGKENLFPLQLSGGELQRIVIARAVISHPKILFCDEPTGNLDQDTSWQIVNLLEQIHKTGTTVVMCTHNVDIVNSMRERVIRLEKGIIISDKSKGKYK
jgi:cell division transport system ATP-binding protein